METGTSIILLTIGALLLLGLVAGYLSPRLHIPRVTLLIVAGVALGPSGFDILPQGHERWYTLFSNIALLMIGFILGGKLSFSSLKKCGRQVFCVSICEVVGVAALVFTGLMLLGVQAEIALVLAGIGPASAPAAVTSVVGSPVRALPGVSVARTRASNSPFVRTTSRTAGMSVSGD